MPDHNYVHIGKVVSSCHKSLTCDDVPVVSAHFCHGRYLPPMVTVRQVFLATGKLCRATDEGARMRITTRLKYGLFRLLGVASPSGAYSLPPRWALSKTGRHRFYDAPDCVEACCPWNRPPAPCLLACCAPVSGLVDAGDTMTVNGHQRGGNTC